LANLTTILANIRQNVIDVPADTEARLEGWVQDAQIAAEDDYQWKMLEDEYSAETILGSRIVAALITGWIEAIGDPYYLTGDGAAVPLEWIPSIQDAMKDYPNSVAAVDRGPPRGLLETGEASSVIINVYPSSDQGNTLGTHSAAGEYDVRIPYRKRQATLAVTGTTENAFTRDANLRLYLEQYASGKALLFNHDTENAQIALLQAQEHLKRAKRTDKRRKSQFIRFTPRRDVHASRRQRRAV
jgi:hypothetical protein